MQVIYSNHQLCFCEVFKVSLFIFYFFKIKRHWPLKSLQLIKSDFLHPVSWKKSSPHHAVNVSDWVNCENTEHLSRFIRQLCSWRYGFQNALMLPLWKQPLAAECYYLTGFTLLKIESLMPLLNFILHTSKQFIIVCSQQL